jgi:hypothetical protein
MTWTELSQRPEELRTRVISVFQQHQLSPQYYFQEKLGLLSDLQLEQHLQNLLFASTSGDTTSEATSNLPPMADAGTLLKAQESTNYSNRDQARESVSSDPIYLEDVRQVRSIGWIRKNGRSTEDREYADMLYQVLLLDLWYRHVAETGETYYPPLQNELLDEYTLISNE